MGKEQFHGIINECEFVLVDDPTFFPTEDHSASSNADNTNFSSDDTIFIEIPTIVAEETIDICSNDSDIWCTENLIDDKNDPLYIPEYESDDEKINNEEEKRVLSKVLPAKPILKIKNIRSLLNSSSNNGIDAPRGVTRKTIKFLSPPPTEKKSTESPEPKDLSWLLNFKLDGLIKSNALDELPQNVHTADARKEDSGAKFQNDKRERKKPPFTYTELIESALDEKGPLTVSEIYQWISDTFPYYKAWDDRWKNSVRHNLSINPYFRKGGKARQGSGHLWTVSKSAESARPWSVKRQRYQDFEAYVKKMRMEDAEMNEVKKQELDDIREAELAAASIAEDKENLSLMSPIQRDIQLPTLNQNNDLEQAVGEILSGVKRNVTVEYIDQTKSINSCNNDFLNPVSKEVLMGECGFLSQIEVNLTGENSYQMEIVETSQVFEQLDDLGFQLNDVANQHMSLVN